MPVVELNGRRMYFEHEGRGKPLVFLSGLGGDSRAFAVSIRSFSRTRQVLALDNRDVGRSDRATAPYTIVDLADDVALWLRTLGIGPADVVGHSLGGLIAQELAIRHPDLVGDLVLVSSHAGGHPWRRAVVESWILLKHRCDAAEFARATMPWLVAPAFYRNATQVEGMVRFAEKNPWPQDAAAFERQARAAIGHEDRELVEKIRARTLVISGELDLVNPPRVAESLARRIPGSRTEILPGVGHLPHVEEGQLFRTILESFLSGT